MLGIPYQYLTTPLEITSSSGVLYGSQDYNQMHRFLGPINPFEFNQEQSPINTLTAPPAVTSSSEALYGSQDYNHMHHLLGTINPFQFVQEHSTEGRVSHLHSPGDKIDIPAAGPSFLQQLTFAQPTSEILGNDHLYREGLSFQQSDRLIPGFSHSAPNATRRAQSDSGQTYQTSVMPSALRLMPY